MFSIELARQEDREHIQRIAKQVFADLGQYQKLLHRFFPVQGVHTVVARTEVKVVGFAMLGFFPWTRSQSTPDGWVAELLAMAVEPGFRNLGAGDALWRHADGMIKQMRKHRNVYEIQTVCPQKAREALVFFEKRGFAQRSGQTHTYADGQKAIRLIKPVEAQPFF